MKKPASAQVKLPEDVRAGVAALRSAAAKIPSHAGAAVAAKFAKSWPRGNPGEVLLVVVGADGLVMSRSTAPHPIDLDELRLRLAVAETAVDTLIDAAPRGAVPPLTAAEAAVLDAGGLPALPREAVDAFERARIEFEVLLRDSLPIEQAARDLGVSTSRLRQRLTGRRTLYGIKDGRGWRIPRFQFAARGKLVHGIDRVLPHVRADAHPLAVVRWFTAPHQDLVIGADDTPVSPVAWLSSGHDVATVAQLAGEI